MKLMFKVGDSIIVKDADKDFKPFHKIGDKGKIVNIRESNVHYPYLVQFEEGETEYMAEAEIELGKKSVYLAGPFFSENQIKKAKMVEKALDNNDTISYYFSPRTKQNFDGMTEFTPEWAKAIFKNDIKEVEKANIVVAIVDLDGQDTDSGTAMEIGYAHALGKEIFLINFEQHDMMVNLMLTECAHAYFTDAEQLQNYDFKELEKIPFNGQYR